MKSIDNKKAPESWRSRSLIGCQHKEINMTLNSVHQNQLTLNHQPLVIGEFSIRQDEDGRYCINDLHKASGGAEKHKPFNFMRNQQTKDLITEIEQESMMLKYEHHKIQAVNTIKGKGLNQGTFVVKELVYYYAMWISAKFHLMVIRAYDTMVMQKFSFEQSNTKRTTKDKRTALHEAIALLMTKSKYLHFKDCYKIIHQRFNVNHLDEIAEKQLPDAVQYVHSLLTGGSEVSYFLRANDAREFDARLHSLFDLAGILGSRGDDVAKVFQKQAKDMNKFLVAMSR